MTVAVTGVAAGLVGGLLMRLLQSIEHIAWQYRRGELLEGISRASTGRHIFTLVAAVLVVGLGSVLIKKMLGVPGEAESAIWFRSGAMPILPTLVKAMHTIVTVGMGSSLGRESPIKQAGGAIASWFAQRAGLSRAEQRLVVAFGVGAGMAAAYNVPVGGALFAVEVLLGGITLRLALPALLCSGVATVASWALLPTEPIYRVPEFPLSIQLTVWAIFVGPLLGLATVPLVRIVGRADAMKPRRGYATIVAPTVVLGALGILSIKFPQLLGNGKDDVQLSYADGFSLTLLLVLPALKLLASAGCIGAGASGGLFTPTMTIGALLGGLLGHLWDRVWPGASMGSCAVIGSSAFLAAASEGPISALVLVLALARHVDATMVPMLIAVVGAMLVARRIEAQSIYTVHLHLNKLVERQPTPSTGAHFSARLKTDFASISAAAPYVAVLKRLLLSAAKSPLYAIDHQGGLVGSIAADVTQHPALGPMPLEVARAADVTHAVKPLKSNMTHEEFALHLSTANGNELPVVDSETGRLIGVIVKR